MRSSIAMLVAVALAATVVGCAEETESPSEVKDLRILAVAAEPPEVLFDREVGWSSPQVEFTALVADPRGTTTTFTWRFCPVESEQACMNFNSLKEQAPQGMRGMLDALFAQHDQGSAPLEPERGVGAMAVAPFATAWPTDLFAYHLAQTGLGLGNGAWPSAVIAVTDSAGKEVLAQKRVTLNARDFAQFNPELQSAFGISVCASAEAATTTPCLPLGPRVANKNPAIVDVLVARGKAADLPFAPFEGPLVVKPNETIRLRPMISPEAFESYQSVQSALQDSRLRVDDQKERPALSWFATAGSLAHEVTAFEATKTFDNTYTAPEVAPLEQGGQVSVWLVVRDLRGGVGWREVRLVVTP